MIGEVAKWVGMIACDDVEMNGRESGFWSEWVGDEFEVLIKVNDLNIMKRWNT